MWGPWYTQQVQGRFPGGQRLSLSGNSWQGCTKGREDGSARGGESRGWAKGVPHGGLGRGLTKTVLGMGGDQKEAKRERGRRRRRKQGKARQAGLGESDFGPEEGREEGLRRGAAAPGA